MGDFLNTLYGKVIAILTIIALLLGIGAEGVSIYRNWRETQTATQVALNAKIKQEADAIIAEERAKTEAEIAKNAKLRQEAEARAAEARTQTEIETAKNAKLRQEAEARISEERAKTELETAKWAAIQKEAEAKRMKAEECSARMKAMIDTTPLQNIGGKAYEDFYRDCDPNYATQSPPAGEACVARVEAFFREVAPKNPHYASLPEVKQWTSDCSGKMSLQQRDRATAIAAAFEKKAAEACENKFKHILDIFDQTTLATLSENVDRVQAERKILENSNCTITDQHNKLYQAKVAEMSDRLSSKALNMK